MSKTALHIETNEDRCQFGDNITVRVRDENGNPVTGVTVQSSTSIAGKTGTTGNATITIQRTGDIDLTANESNTQNLTYVLGTKKVAAIKKVIKLCVETDKDMYQVGEDITVQVSDHNGKSVPDVTVRYPNGIVATTDATGKTYITIQQTGPVELMANKADGENVGFVASVPSLCARFVSDRSPARYCPAARRSVPATASDVRASSSTGISG
jgi:hypothetical protein